MKLQSTLLVSIYCWNTIVKPSFMAPMATTAFSTATAAATACASSSSSKSSSSSSIVRVRGSAVESVNTNYTWTPATSIPPGFEKVCVQNHWEVENTWKMLNNGKSWLRASNDAYIYFNSNDNQWWIDKPDGNGVYVAPNKDHHHQQQQQQQQEGAPQIPPGTGWKALSSSYNPVPTSVELINL